MAKVVYLFGAGASYNAIPVVAGMKTRLKTMLDFYRNGFHIKREFYTNQTTANFIPNRVTIRPDVEAVVNELNTSYSIDTVARKAQIRGEEKYELVKQIIAAYIVWEQVVNKNSIERLKYSNFGDDNYRNQSTNYFSYLWDGNPRYNVLPNEEIRLTNYDYRYESLVSLITNKKNELDADFGFISWNYDSQLEKAIIDMHRIESADNAAAVRFNSLVSSRILKLNGSALNIDQIIELDEVKNQDKQLFRIANFLRSTKNEFFENDIKFAWENEPIPENLRNLELLNNTEKLIIIGYSFPAYNRQIDRMLLTKLYGNGHPLQIIIQDKESVVRNIKERIISILPQINTEKIKESMDLDLFYNNY